MAKDFSKYADNNPVMKILNEAKEEEAQSNSMKAPSFPIPAEEKIEPKAVEQEVKVQIAEEKPAVTENKPQPQPEQEPEPVEIKKILMNISIRESTKKEWKMFFLEHDLSMTQGIETAVEYLMSEVKKNNIKLSKGGITK